MSLVDVFAPRRFARLVISDAQNAGRDPILVFAIVLSLIFPILLALFRDAADAAALSAFGIAGISRYAATVAVALPAYLVGWVTGFLLLEDRDDGPLLAMEITPIGKGGFLAYRVAVTALLGFAVALFAARLMFPEMGWDLAAFISLLVAVEAVIVAFVLLAVASNKVEGLAITKLTNIGSIVPLVAILPWPWRYLAGIVPSYWLGELVTLSSVRYLPLWADAGLAVAVHVLAAMFMYRLITRRIG